MGDAATVKEQLLELFRRMVFNILMANTDDHEKNHAFLVEQNGRVPILRLSPAYDVVTSGNGAVAHEFLISEDSSEALLSNAMHGCLQFDLTREEAENEIQKIIASIEGWKTHFKACGVTEKDIEELAAFIDSNALLHERKTFGKTQSAPPTKKVRSPFGTAER
jgi:serine/threonine-protein kinase HipA